MTATIPPRNRVYTDDEEILAHLFERRPLTQERIDAVPTYGGGLYYGDSDLPYSQVKRPRDWAEIWGALLGFAVLAGMAALLGWAFLRAANRW